MIKLAKMKMFSENFFHKSVSTRANFISKFIFRQRKICKCIPLLSIGMPSQHVVNLYMECKALFHLFNGLS